MKINIRIHKKLQKYTNGHTNVDLNVSTYKQLLSALEVTFPKLKKVITDLKNEKSNNHFGLIDLDNERYLTTLDYWKKKISSSKLCLIPLVAGSGGDMGEAIAIAVVATVLIISGQAWAAALIAEGAAATSATVMLAGAVTSFGWGLMGAAIVTAFTPKPKAPEQGPDAGVRENDYFGSLRHTLNAGTTIPLIYGLHRTAGQILSAEVRTLEKAPSKLDDLVLQELVSNS